MVDAHVHFPQIDVIGSPADGLLPWLENYTFPHEARFADPVYAAQIAEVFLDELLRHGITTAMTYCSSHAASAEAFFAASEARGLRMVAGKCLMDRNSPEPVRDDTHQGLRASQALIERWHGRGRLGYALTPRFAPSCTDAQMLGAAGLAPASRQHFATGIAGYVASPLWLAQLVIGLIIVLQTAWVRPEYFSAEFGLYPVWPRFAPAHTHTHLSLIHIPEPTRPY